MGTIRRGRDLSPLPQIKVLAYKDGDVICRCPVCGHTGPLMAVFSLLAAGFNGIKRGGADDLDVQECGHCAAKLRWDNVEAVYAA